MTEPVQPHLVAHAVSTFAHEINANQVESTQLAAILDQSQLVWRSLKSGQFCKTPQGYITFGVLDDSGDWTHDSGNYVSGLRVEFTNSAGHKTTIGEVHRLPNRRAATARKMGQGGKLVPMLPDDPWWDAIVGSILRAIAECAQA